MRPPVDWPTSDLLAERAMATPDRTALVDADSDETWTYREFERRAEAYVPALDLATPPADVRVGLLLDRPTEVARLLFAAMRRAFTVVPLNVRLTASELRPQIEAADVDLLVCERDTEERAVEAAGCPVRSVDAPVDGSVRRLSADEGAVAVPSELDRGTEAVVLFTSGTTGEPKGVRLTVGNLVASAVGSAFRLGVTPGDRWLCCLPTYHMGGLAPVLRSVLYGTTVVVQDGFDADETAAVMDEHGVTGVSLVPTMLRRLLDGGWSPPDHLRFVLLGGAPAPPGLIDECEARDVPVHPTYGMTEAASQIATARPAEAFEHEGTVGQPLLGTDVTVVDDRGTPCRAGEQGELAVDGPTVTPGYLDDDHTDAAFGEHGLRTGDVGYRDGDGRLWVRNRLDDRIITGGENVDPGEVVAALREHEAVRDAAVVGLDDPEWGQRVAALVVAADGHAPSEAAVERHCRERLAGYKCPRTVRFAPELPRTASGTVDRGAVRDRLR